MIELNSAPNEVLTAIANGYFYDDSGRDVRATQSIDRYDHNGKSHDPAIIYRLWNALDSECLGISFTVYEFDGAIETHRLASSGGNLAVEEE